MKKPSQKDMKPFAYWVWLRDRKGRPYIYRETVSWVIPKNQIEHCYDQFAEKLGLCKECDGNFSHVIEEDTGRKFCPILLIELVNPRWRLKDLV